MRNLLPALLFLVATTAAGTSPIDHLLAAAEAPSGVVFEIVEADEDALAWALPRVTRLSQQLRERFPGLQIAVVAHGREQFALLSERQRDESDIHQSAIELGRQSIDLHVCAVHASWYGHAPEEFPAYIDVSASGPAQINDYEALGFERIRIEEHD